MTHTPEIFGILKAQNGHFPELKAHRSGNLLGWIGNARAKLVTLLHVSRDFG
jgi:hypothetical protein